MPARTDHLAAATGHDLDVVDRRAERDVLERQRVADARLCLRPGDDSVTDVQAVGHEHVALLAVGVVQQADARRAVRVVLDRRQLRGHVVLVALEVDPAVEPLLAAAAMADGQATLVVAAADALLRLEQRLVRLVGRDLLERRPRLETTCRPRLACRNAAASSRSPRRIRSSGRWPASRRPSSRASSSPRCGRGDGCVTSPWPSWSSTVTSITSTLKSSSMASLTISLLASLWTRNVYLPRCVSSIDFSLMTGRTICGCLERHAYTSAIVVSDGCGMSTRVRVEHVDDVERVGADDDHAGQVACRQLEVLPRYRWRRPGSGRRP